MNTIHRIFVIGAWSAPFWALCWYLEFVGREQPLDMARFFNPF
jgi:hypothetical protein